VKVESKLILTSKNSVTGVNLYTFVLTYPRVILAEVNTHRMLSRNTASSRAIPSKKQRARVINDPFVPISIGANQKGMQAGEELEGWRRAVAIQTWKLARYPMVLASWILDKVGAHKQVVNRIVEPWTWTQQIVTCTDLRNVFKLRNHKDAEPHFQELAKQMQRQVEIVQQVYRSYAWNLNNPVIDLKGQDGIGIVQILKPGYHGAGDMDWHLPFIDIKDTWAARALVDKKGYEERTSPTVGTPLTVLDILKMVSTARCARVSYFLPENGERSDIERDMELCGRLSSSGHWSPFEHVATPTADDTYFGNFRSFKQYRKYFDGEHGGDRWWESHCD
jgi:thymidylate synthase ThyX